MLYPAQKVFILFVEILISQIVGNVIVRKVYKDLVIVFNKILSFKA